MKRERDCSFSFNRVDLESILKPMASQLRIPDKAELSIDEVDLLIDPIKYNDDPILRELREDIEKCRAYVYNRKTYGMNVGIEIETCCEKVPSLYTFDSKEDSTIRCAKEFLKAKEFVMKEEYSHLDRRVWGSPDENLVYRDIREILAKCEECALSDHVWMRGESSCGVHIHFSSNDLTVAHNPMFGPLLLDHWCKWAQTYMVDKYQLRKDNSYCQLNYMDDLEDTLSERHLMLNATNSWHDGLWHFECRGMQDLFRYGKDDVRKSDVDPNEIRISTLAQFIEDLCEFFKMCEFDYSQHPHSDIYQETLEFFEYFDSPVGYIMGKASDLGIRQMVLNTCTWESHPDLMFQLLKWDARYVRYANDELMNDADFVRRLIELPKFGAASALARLVTDQNKGNIVIMKLLADKNADILEHCSDEMRAELCLLIRDVKFKKLLQDSKYFRAP